MTPVRWFRRRGRPPKMKMPNWTGRAVVKTRPLVGTSFNGAPILADGYAFNGRGDLVSLKREARRQRARERNRA